VNEGRLREALREAPVPAEMEAWERARALARAAYPPPSATAPRYRHRRALQLALALSLIAALVSPAGAAIRHWVRDAVEVGHKPSLPALTSLPARGSLLVDSPRGTWVVHASGSKRLLGDYSQSGWSPHGLFVAVTSRHQLAAVDPEGNVHWELSRLGPVRNPAWSPDGYRIAYLDGGELRVVAGDGTGDRVLAQRVGPVAPAWQPGDLRRLAFLDAAGRVEVVNADSDRSVFKVPARPGTIGLAWSADGARLLVVRRSGLRVFDSQGRPLWQAQAPAGMRVRAGVLAPDGKRVTAVLSTRSGRQSEVLVLGRGGEKRRLFAGLGRFGNVVYSPDGRWLLVAWRSANQWLFLRPAHPRRIVAVSDISRQFDPGTTSPPPFPSVAGWCCRASQPQG
jgi:Tol biopolymer transport system component